METTTRTINRGPDGRFLPKAGQPGRRRRYLDAEEREQRAKRYLVTVPYIQTLSDWSLADILAAIKSHEQGTFARSGLLWQWMQRDPRLRVALNVRTSGLAALPFSVDPATKISPPPEEQRIADLLLERWWSCFPESTLRGSLRTAVGMGFILAQVRWSTGPDGLWWPALEVWPAHAVRYDDPTRKWRVQTREGAEIDVCPGDGQWFLWQPDGARGFQLGGVCALGLPVFLTLRNWESWINYGDAHGRPAIKVEVPKQAQEAEKNAFLANVKALDSTTRAIICGKNLDGSGFDFSYVSAGGTEITTFEKAIEQAAKDKALVVLGQTLTTDVADKGSYSLGEIHNLIRQVILKADAEGFSTALREQVLVPWARYNFGRGALAPWPKWDTKPPADRKTEAETYTAAAAAVAAVDSALKGTGKRVKRVAYFEQLEIKLEDDPGASRVEPATATTPAPAPEVPAV